MVNALRVLGSNLIEEVAAQPRAPLAQHLARAGASAGSGVRPCWEPIEPIWLPETPEVRCNFMEPIAAETIAKYIGKLVVQLCAVLEERGLGARRLNLPVQLVDNRQQAVRVDTGKPVRNAKLLTRMLCEKIETIDPGFGIEVLVLTAIMSEPMVPRQSVSSLIKTPEADVSDLIDILSNRVGEDRLFRYAPVASDVPERWVKRVDPSISGGGICLISERDVCRQ